MKEDIEELLKSADDDLNSSIDNLKLNHYRISCFLAQQAVEKYLKAFLLYINNGYPFIHNIKELINKCIKYNKDFEYLLNIKPEKLNKYYSGTRYPPFIIVNEEDAKEAIDIAEKVREFIYKKLNIDNNI
ncbi:HEPN domain-containing protein [Nanobdella aerobiophila]|uniref:HEPN domain-containing protein n=1 Tax=Nanobdella aerobiophila TaxID=2586965 RepID=UPI0021ACB702|nr:HEPN domain-containing protein [Nanobdella aerobiophila]